MISNGFQARLLNGNLISIEETFALTPACSLFEGKGGSAASSIAGDFQEHNRKAIFPSISVDCYSAAYRPKALSVVRRGAVFVSPISSTVTSSAGTSQTPVAKENKLYLAFRWAGSEHNNAEAASDLGDIADDNLQKMRAIGLMQSGLTSEADGSAPAAEKSSNDNVKGSKSMFSLFKRPSKEVKKKISLSARSSKSKAVASVKEQPFLAQLYFDNKLIPLTSIESKDGDGDKQLSTVQLVGGALLDLGVVGWALPDAPANEILHTITLHLWDATRPDVHIGPPFKSGHQVRWGPKKSVVPNVIFHFEIVSSGPQEAIKVRPALVASPSSKSKSRKSALVEEFSPPLPSHPLDGKLASVAEESSLRSADDASLNQASRHAKMRKAAAIAADVIKPRPRTSSLPPDGPLSRGFSARPSTAATETVNTDEKINVTEESPLKTFIRKVTFGKSDSSVSTPSEEEVKVIDVKGKSVQVEEPQVDVIPKVPRIKRVPPPIIEESSPRQSPGIPLIRVVSTGSAHSSSRKSSSKGVESNSLADAKRISLLGMTGTGHNELVETIELVQGLKREHIQIENERKMLEDQWSKTLLKSMEEDVAMLKKRVEEGKREVDLLRKRVWPAMAS